MHHHDELDEVAPEIIARDRYPDKPDGHFGPSQVSGCALKVFLNKMTDHEVTPNSWMFAGTAVHYYLQESGILDEALHRAGYHPAYTKYEKPLVHHINDDVAIDGTTDIYVGDGNSTAIYDIKFTSLPIGTGHGRVYKYFSQANTYAQMAGADDYGLIMINSKSQNLRDNIAVLDGELSDENWEIVKNKATNIHAGLKAAGYYAGDRWTLEELAEKDVSFWEEIVSYINMEHVPSYDKECQYCDHSDYCPEKQGKLGGLNGLINDKG